MVKIQKILVPIDFSDHSQKAVRYGVAIARDHKAELFILHVINQRIIDAVQEMSIRGYEGNFVQLMEKMIADRETDLQNFVPPDWRSGLEVELHITKGKPATEIIDFAKRKQVDLIVLGTQGRSPLVSALLGSAARAVVDHAPCPVLVVRPTEHDFVE
jgi:nucleotide-binding universal stress UspA family protein